MAFITLQVWTFSERIIINEAGVDWTVDAMKRIFLTLCES